MSEISKIQAQKEFKTGKYTKAELARKYNVSARTLGRWVESIQAKSEPVKTQPAVKKSTGGFAAAALKTLNPGTNVSHQPTVPAAPATVVEYSVVATPRSVSITKTVNDKVEGTLAVNNSAPMFNTVLTKLKTFGVFDQSVLAECYLLLKPAEAIKQVSQGRLSVDVVKGVITYKSESGSEFKVDNSLASRIVSALKQEGKLTSTVESLMKFLDNLMLNPSNRATKELYGFLTANDIEITEDGHFLAWKKVRPDYMDIHSNTMLNKPGLTLSVDRNQVDEDSEKTCSYGLHVCSKSYLPQFGTCSNNKVVRVKVHPKDVVAVPKDYNNAKLRCCGYYVVDDVTDSKIWK